MGEEVSFSWVVVIVYLFFIQWTDLLWLTALKYTVEGCRNVEKVRNKLSEDVAKASEGAQLGSFCFNISIFSAVSAAIFRRLDRITCVM